MIFIRDVLFFAIVLVMVLGLIFFISAARVQ